MKTRTPGGALKTRMITVRISNEEYEAICEVTIDLGFRNVSELARAALRALVGSSHHPTSAPVELKLADRIEEHDMLLRSLLHEMRRLKRVTGERGRTATRNNVWLPTGMPLEVTEED
jgi:Arc/MetJ-type ribon-helix-helix transcriptional regulator